MKKRLKLIVGVFISVMLLVGCTKTRASFANIHRGTFSVNDDYDAYAMITEKEIYRVSEIMCYWMLDYTGYLGEYEKYPVVALVHVDTISGGRVYRHSDDDYGYPHTYGVLTVLEIYKGNNVITKGEHYSYIRFGGIVTREELNSDPRHDNYSGKTKYIELMYNDDVRIEVGKDYVVFIGRNYENIYSNGEELYIDGLELGLREVTRTDSGLKILNNHSKEWENLAEVIPLNSREMNWFFGV